MCSAFTVVETMTLPCFVGQKQQLDKEMMEVVYSKLPSGVTLLRLHSAGQNKNATIMHYLFSLVAVGRLQHIR